MAQVSERVVLVTGAGKGLGRAFALRCAEGGAAVVVNNRRRGDDADSAAAVAREIVEGGGRAVAVCSDVRDDGAGASMVEVALEAFGRLDALILNAGVSGPAARFERQDASAFAEVMAINFTANVRLLQAAFPALRRSPAGRVVMVASTAGLYGTHGLAPYAASKGAVIALALTLAGEWRRDGMFVNVLCPYATTNMTPATDDPAFDAVISPQAAAPAAAWLSSAACPSSGEVWVAGGGRLARAAVMESPTAPLPSDGPFPQVRPGDGAPHPDAMAAFRSFTAGLRGV